MKKMLLCLVALISVCGAEAQTSTYTFNPKTRYSRLAIESRITDFYANKKQRGLNAYDAKGNIVGYCKEQAFDYVPGMVAKGIIEAAEYYKDSVWAKGWYYSVEDYANRFAADIETVGGSLDNLNAAKMYFGLQNLASGPYKGIANAQTLPNVKVALDNTLKGLTAHNSKYSISAKLLPDAAGGWWHKDSYDNQMWLDGQYMGPALLAQMVNVGYFIDLGKGSDKANIEANWALIANQFKIVWNHLWDKDKQLLWHAFAADPKAATAKCWADSATLHNPEYWGRAEGWYFLALVDVLEQMQVAGLTASADYAALRGYLNEVAAGLVKYQDANNGCWYQLLAHDGNFAADTYQGVKYNMPVKNFIESSATAIFIASYLKGQRLGLYDADYSAVAQKAYKGFVEHFLVDDGSGKGTVHLYGSCRSAGLGGNKNRDGSAAYYLLGHDVPQVLATEGITEGKVLGAFILAATEYERAFMSGK